MKSSGDNSEEKKYTVNFENLQNQLAIFNETWHKSSLGKRELKIAQIKGQVLFKGEIITKVHKEDEK
jgi:hypothetical protein